MCRRAGSAPTLAIGWRPSGVCAGGLTARALRAELHMQGAATARMIFSPANRFGDGTISRHAFFALAGLTIGAGFAAIAGASPSIHYLSLATAYASLIYLTLSLLVGPVRVLKGGRPIISSNRRRHFGIWSGVFAIAHVASGLNVHLSGDYLAYFFSLRSGGFAIRPRLDQFGLANDLGLVATLIIIVLLCISNNVSIRKLGIARWKTIQRLAYVMAAIVVVHSAVYMVIERRLAVLVWLFVAIVILTLTAQTAALAAARKVITPIVLP